MFLGGIYTSTFIVWYLESTYKKQSVPIIILFPFRGVLDSHLFRGVLDSHLFRGVRKGKGHGLNKLA